MATIPDTTVRAEKFSGSRQQLEQVLDSIPFTTRQRNDIDHYVADMARTFEESNEAVDVYDALVIMTQQKIEIMQERATDQELDALLQPWVMVESIRARIIKDARER